MAYDLDAELVMGIAAQALVDREQENRAFAQQGVEACARRHVEQERVPLKPGPGNSLAPGLLRIDNLHAEPAGNVSPSAQVPRHDQPVRGP